MPRTSLRDALQPLSPSQVVWVREEKLDAQGVSDVRNVLKTLGIALIDECPLAGGEEVKSLETLNLLWKRWVQAGLRKDGLVLSTGGGALSDVVGLAASLHQRGVRVAHMPTTTLAMIDAAWGGKTAVNFDGIKNHLGSFHPPSFVLMDPRWLDTLDERTRQSGLAEGVKHFMLSDPAEGAALADLERAASPPHAWADDVVEILSHAARIKMNIVREDPLESGLRTVLNLGHTVGHAVESWSHAQGSPWLHGEAVAAGLLFALHEQRHPGLTTPAGNAIEAPVLRPEHEVPEGLVALLESLAFGKALPTAAEAWHWMAHDKKNRANAVRDIAWRGCGSVVWPACWEKQAFEATWRGFLRLPNKSSNR